jgi:GT2 family glycosyltransferase
VSNSTTPKVSVVMAFFKKREDADQALASIFKTAYRDFEVIFVDNASNEDAADFLQKKYPRLKIVKNDENRGSGAAWNSGFRLVSPTSKYVTFVDYDLIFDSRWLSELVRVAETDPKIGGCQPKVLSFWDPSTFDYNGTAGMWMDAYGYTVCRGRIFNNYEKDVGQHDSTCETFFAGGSVLFARCDILRKIGLFDESFFAYHDELDLSWRVRLNGYKLYSVPCSVVWHEGGAKTDKATMLNKYRNNVFMLIKNYSLKNLVKYLPLRFILDIISIVKNGVAPPLEAYVWLLKNSKLVWSHRNKVQTVRRCSDEELMGIIVRQPSPILHYLLGYAKWSDFAAINPGMFRQLKN